MANYIPEEKITEVRNAVDIVDIVSDSVVLKKTGKNFVGLCPFHSEKTPSFTVSNEKQIYHCFGCGAGGNVFSFLMKQEGYSFPETVRWLAKRYGVEIPSERLTPDERRRIREREYLFDVNRQALEYYHRTLTVGEVGRPARNYLRDRGITPDIQDGFQLGFAPGRWDNIVQNFSQKRISSDIIAKAGLVVPKKDKMGYYDRFRNRIIFPILDVNNRVLGFGGRVLDDSLPKYLNSPETAIYNKRKTLYGLNRAKDKCRLTNTVFIVEGYLDLISLHQNGIENSVATLGTALTVEQIRLLTRFAGKMILVYDSDEAGIRSAQRCIEFFWKEHVDFRRGDIFKEDKADTRILILPHGHDPDSFVQEFGAEAFLKEASQAPGVISFLIDRAVDKHGLSTEGKIRIIEDLRRPLAAINDNVAKSLYIKKLSEKVFIDETVVLEKIRATNVGNTRNSNPGAASLNADLRLPPVNSQQHRSKQFKQIPGDRYEKLIIAMMLQFPRIIPEAEKMNVLSFFESSILKSIGEDIVAINPSISDPGAELITRVKDHPKRELIAALAIGDESWTLEGGQKLLINYISKKQKLSNNRLLQDKIKIAEKNNDQATLLKLLDQKQKLAIQNQKQKIQFLREK